jgi:hypothetical protein
MSTLKPSFLPFLLLTACAADEVTGTTTDGMFSTAQHFEVAAFDLDPILLETAPDDLTQGSVHVDPLASALEVVIVFDLFPSFYETSIEQRYVDACGAVHYEGHRETPDRPDTQATIHLIDHASARCPHDYAAVAELKTVRDDGRPTRSTLYLARSR